MQGRLSLNMCLRFQQSPGATLLYSLSSRYSNPLLIVISLAYPSDALRGLIAFRAGFTDAPDAVVAQPVRCGVTHVVI